MIPEQVAWVRFPARINTAYSKLPSINDLLLKILYQTQIFAIDILVEYQIRKFFQLCCIKIQFIKTNSSTFPPTSCIFYVDLAIPITVPFQVILQSCKLVIDKWQIKTFPIMLSRQLNSCVLLAQQLFYVYYKGQTLLFFNLHFLLLLSERG